MGPTEPSTMGLDIKMVDLSGQYLHIKQEMDMAIQETLDSSVFINGKKVWEFGEHLAKKLAAKAVIPCGNGTDALQVSLMALDLTPGDEVIVPAFTYVASAEVIALLRLKPVLVDVQSDTFNVDPQKIEKAITPKTKAIIPVHLFGQCADMEPILDLANRQNIYVVEDNAQAIMAGYTFRDGKKQKAGTIGDLGTLSFFPSKNLGCYGDGGAIIVNDEKLAATVKMLANHGQSKKYYFDRVGCNSRLDTLQAAILDVKLKYIDAYTTSRQHVADGYRKVLADVEQVELPATTNYSTHVYHQFTIKTDPAHRDHLKTFLLEKGIPSMIYYPVPIHLQKAYAYLNYRVGEFPVSEQLSASVLSLPVHTEMDQEQVDYIADSIKQYFSQKG